VHEITSSPTPTPVAERQPGKVADQPATEALIDFEDPDVVSRARLRVLDDSGETCGRAVDGRAVDRHVGEPCGESRGQSRGQARTPAGGN
jgi:hypothetical protein